MVKVCPINISMNGFTVVALAAQESHYYHYYYFYYYYNYYYYYCCGDEMVVDRTRTGSRPAVDGRPVPAVPAVP